MHNPSFFTRKIEHDLTEVLISVGREGYSAYEFEGEGHVLNSGEIGRPFALLRSGPDVNSVDFFENAEDLVAFVLTIPEIESWDAEFARDCAPRFKEATDRFLFGENVVIVQPDDYSTWRLCVRDPRG